MARSEDRLELHDIEPLPNPETGYLAAADARDVAEACMLLGAGRTVRDAPIDYAVGIQLHKKRATPCERVNPSVGSTQTTPNDWPRHETSRGRFPQHLTIRG